MKTAVKSKIQRRQPQRTRHQTNALEAPLSPHIRLAIRMASLDCGVPTSEIIKEIAMATVAKVTPGILHVYFDGAERKRLARSAELMHLTPEEFLGMMAFEGVRQVEALGNVILTNLPPFDRPTTRNNKAARQAEKS